MPDSLQEHQNFVVSQVLPDPNIQSGFIETPEFKLHYRSNGRPEKAVAIWVHGTPGGWSDIGRLLVDDEFLSEFMLVSLDRPGWGQSQFKDTPRIIPEFQQQARFIGPLIEHLGAEYESVPLILVGHSWGGSLAPYLALEYSHILDGVIILAGGLDPELVKPRWYNKAGKLVNGLLSDAMQGANQEVYALSPELSQLANRWQEISVPVIVVQGEKDGLVDPKNANYAEKKLKPEHSHILRLPKQGHLLQMERVDLIARCIRAMADQSLSDCREQQ